MSPVTDPDMDPEQELYDSVVDQNSDVMDFVLTREKHDPGQTFSAEGMEAIFQAMRTFVVARVMHHWKKRGTNAPGPSRMTVHLSVQIDGVTIEVPPDLLPWFAVDGTNRAKATRRH